MEHVDNLSEQQLKGIEDVYNQLLPQITPVYGKNVEKTELPEVEETFEVENSQEVKSEIEKNQKLWEEVKDKWIESGRTETDFNSMSNEEREHIIENCL